MLRDFSRTPHLFTLAFCTLLAACDTTDDDKDGTGSDTLVETDSLPDTDSVPDTDTPPDTDTDSDSDSDAAPLPGVETLAEGDLIITEFMPNPDTCSDENGEYVEFLYRGDVPVDLTGLQLSDTDSAQLLTGDLVAQPGQRFLIARQSTQPCFDAEPDAIWPAISMNNGGDVISLTTASGTVFDRIDYTSAGLDLAANSGRAWELRGTALISGNNDNPDDWCLGLDLIAPSATNYGTPGAPNTACGGDDTGIDSGAAGLTDTFDTGPGTTGPFEAGLGDLVITEIMPNPSDCVDDDAEYFEVVNVTSAPIHMGNMTIADNFATWTVPQGVIVQPGEPMLFFRSTPSGTQCYGYVDGVDGVSYGSVLQFSNSNDILTIENAAGTLIDTVTYSSSTWPLSNGVSLSLSADALDASLNDDPDNWCFGALPLVGFSGDFGTGGALNPVCLQVDTSESGLGIDSYVSIDSGLDTFDTSDFVDETGQFLTQVHELQPGDLIINEVLPSPTDCADADAEYFTVINTTGDRVALNGLLVTIDGTTFTYSGTARLQPGAEMALWPEPATTQCYGFTPGTDGIAYHPSLQLSGIGSQLELSSPLGLIDAVNYSGWGVTTGSAWQLDPDRYNDVQNDDNASWCLAPTIVVGGVGDFGTPLFANAECAGVDPLPDASTPPVDTDSDTTPPGDTGAPETGTPDTDDSEDSDPPLVDTGVVDSDVDSDSTVDSDTDAGVVTVSLDQAVPGDVIITEIMINPGPSVFCNDQDGEYFEVTNMTGSTSTPVAFAMDGMQFQDNAISHVYVGSAVLLPGASMVFYKQPAPGDVQCFGFDNPLLSPDAAPYDSLLAFGNAGDEILISAPAPSGTLLDAVNFDTPGWLLPTEASLNLDPGLSQDHVSNDDPNNWCVSINEIGGGNTGTPNAFIGCDIDLNPVDTAGIPDSAGDSFPDSGTPPDTDSPADTDVAPDTDATPDTGTPAESDSPSDTDATPDTGADTTDDSDASPPSVDSGAPGADTDTSSLVQP
ncbi:MAG: lamin tail domain-containing protein [Myxococcota bacterium]